MVDVCHGGCLGDIIAALPALKEFARRSGHVRVHLYPRVGPRVRMSPQYAALIVPLLKAQPYIADARYSASPVGLTLDDWRNRSFPRVYSLADRHLDLFGYPHVLRDKSWLDLPDGDPPAGVDADVTFCRSPRLRNPKFDWKRYHRRHPHAVFVGLREEHYLFEREVGPVRFVETSDLLQVAKVIKRAKLVVTNQTCHFWLAEAMKKSIVLEVEPNGTDWNCHHDRAGLTYVQNSTETDVPAIEPLHTLRLPQPTDHSTIAFLGLLPDENFYHAAYREFTPSASSVRTAVRYQRYDADYQPVGESRMLLKNGEDPRVFRWRGEPYASTVVYAPIPSHGEWRQMIVHLPSGRTHALAHPLLYGGKNWVPVTGGEELLMVRSVDPLCVLRVDTSAWEAETITPDPRTRHIGEYRGGGAARIINGKIVGYGHRTITRPALRHVPFKYEVDVNDWSVILQDLRPHGFGEDQIIDPTAELGADLVCSCSQKSWWQEQTITTKICRISP
jgi:hypothetical protein